MTDRLRLHELLLAGLAALLASALILAGAVRDALGLAAALAAFLAAAWALDRFDPPHGFRARLLAAYAFTFFLYATPKWVVPALGLEARDPWLRAADATVFGETPAALIHGLATPLVNDAASAIYLGFHGYLHLALAWALVGPRERADRFGAWVFGAYAPGIAGYFLVPAMGPVAAFADLFPAPIAGGALTQLNAAIVAGGSSVYDLFPSLHVYVTLVLLEHDRHAAPGRFRLLRPLALLIPLSTLVLRYHYAVDLAAGALLFLAWRRAHPWLEAAWADRRPARTTEHLSGPGGPPSRGQ